MSSPVPEEDTRLNAISPYFAMFPLSFPLGILAERAVAGQRVLDPFCGRGTTNFAARLLGLATVGIDASRVAVAATKARLVGPKPETLGEAAADLLNCREYEAECPEGEFWRWAYEESVLRQVCTLRKALLESDLPLEIAEALRGIVLGALHGPVGRAKSSYFSNQCPRTYAPKPRYATRFWKGRDLRPRHVDVRAIISERAARYYGKRLQEVDRSVALGDSREEATVKDACKSIGKIDWVITSPPYYGLGTYVPDQWLRNWFLGGPSEVEYVSEHQMSHNGRVRFTTDLSKVWRYVGRECEEGARMVVRFGGIGRESPDSSLQVVRASIEGTGWVCGEVRDAGTAARGRRQATSFRGRQRAARGEMDVWAEWRPESATLANGGG